VSAHAKDDPRIDLAISEAAASLEDDTLRRDSAERAAAKGAQQDAKLLVARARNSECRALANLGENEKAKTVCEEAVRIFAEAGDRAGMARSLHSMAEVPLNQGDLISAEKLYREALAILRGVGDKRASGSELLNLGMIWARNGFAHMCVKCDTIARRDRAAGRVVSTHRNPQMAIFEFLHRRPL
jgi:tetratricopeptide (TPR) repeat protein